MLKRYFLLEKLPDPEIYRPRGFYHCLSVDGGYVAVVIEEGTEVPDDWIELPHLLDSTALKDAGVDHARLGVHGVKGEHSMFQAARALAKINPLFKP